MSPAQGIEQLDANEFRDMFAQLRHEIHAGKSMQGDTGAAEDKNWFFDEWIGGTLDAPGTSHLTLSPQIDRPIVINSIVATLATGSTSGWVWITNKPLAQFGSLPVGSTDWQSRLISVPINQPLLLQGIQMIVLPGYSFQLIAQPNPPDPTSMFLEVMGAYMRNSEWRRF